MTRTDLILLALVMFGGLVLDLGGLLAAAYVGSRPDAVRNTAAGLRTRTLTASDEAWRIGHAEALRWAKFGVISVVVPAVIVLFLLDSAPGVVAVVETLLFVTGLTLLAWAVRSAHRAVEAWQAGPLP